MSSEKQCLILINDKGRRVVFPVLYYTRAVHNERAQVMQSIVRDYWSVWKQFVLHGVMQEDILPPALMQSWRRCAALGLDPYRDREIRESTLSNHPSTAGSHKLLSR